MDDYYSQLEAVDAEHALDAGASPEYVSAIAMTRIAVSLERIAQSVSCIANNCVTTEDLEEAVNIIGEKLSPSPSSES